MEIFELPMLYGISRVGKVKQWQAKVELNENGTATIFIESGYVDGKIQSKPKLVAKGKNIGKSNETTPYQQALSQISSQWSAKRFENYEPHMLDPNNYTPRLMLPQLAKGVGKGKINSRRALCSWMESSKDWFIYQEGKTRSTFIRVLVI